MWVPLGIFVIRSFRPEETRFDCAPEKLVLKPSSQSRPNVSSILFYGDAIVLFWVILLSVFRLSRKCLLRCLSRGVLLTLVFLGLIFTMIHLLTFLMALIMFVQHRPGGALRLFASLNGVFLGIAVCMIFLNIFL